MVTFALIVAAFITLVLLPCMVANGMWKVRRARRSSNPPHLPSELTLRTDR